MAEQVNDDRPRMLVWFSCGAASATAAKIATSQYADDFNVEVLYCDLFSDEHPDNRRFFNDVQQWIGQEIKVLSHPKYSGIYDVFRKDRYIAGVAGARCSLQLKKRQRIAYQRPDDVHVIGFTVDETSRAERFDKSSPEIDMERVLVDRGITKTDCHLMIESAGIEQPAMYRMGYNNNNCLGCVKGGMGYWNKIKHDFPDRFSEMAKIEREVGASCINGVYLDELDPSAGRHDDFEIDCGMFCEARQRELTELTTGATQWKSNTSRHTGSASTSAETLTLHGKRFGD